MSLVFVLLVLSLYLDSAIVCIGFRNQISFSSLTNHKITLAGKNFYYHERDNINSIPSTTNTRLYSYGDPDNSPKWRFLRWWQEQTRIIDKIISLPDHVDPDVPGWTYPSPIQWAPWMETIWFGNLYDYRSAFFHDVMYSNGQQTNKEGALLVRDATKALQIALLYQRYEKFDPATSYSIPNATFYNLFAMESLRMGRYKVPQSDDLCLCTTDPLTFSELKRYLNSFNSLKWFKSAFFQQKRKRQYVMSLSDNQLFFNAIYNLEYDRIVRSQDNKQSAITIATIPSNTLSFDIHESGVTLPLAEVNAQYFLENFYQTVISYIASSQRIRRVLVGGDGRLFSDVAYSKLRSVLQGNGIEATDIRLAPNGLLTIPLAEAMLSSPDIDEVDLAVVFTAPGKAAGIRGFFGFSVIVNHQPHRKAEPKRTIKVLNESDWNAITSRLLDNRFVQLIPSLLSNLSPPQPAAVSLEETALHRKYFQRLRAEFDFHLIQSFLSKSGLLLGIDCLYGLSSRFLEPLLRDVLGVQVAEQILLYNNRYSNTFANRDPNCLAISNCGESRDLFNIALLHEEVVKQSMLETIIEPIEPIETDEGDSSYSGPDLGFVFNSDASSCSVLLPGDYLSPMELKTLLGPASTSAPVEDGVRTMLRVLTLLANYHTSVASTPKASISVQSMLSEILLQRKLVEDTETKVIARLSLFSNNNSNNNSNSNSSSSNVFQSLALHLLNEYVLGNNAEVLLTIDSQLFQSMSMNASALQNTSSESLSDVTPVSLSLSSTADSSQFREAMGSIAAASSSSFTLTHEAMQLLQLVVRYPDMPNLSAYLTFQNSSSGGDGVDILISVKALSMLSVVPTAAGDKKAVGKILARTMQDFGCSLFGWETVDNDNNDKALLEFLDSSAAIIEYF